MMMDETIALLKQLVAFDTDSTKKSNYVECARFLENYAKEKGLHAQTFTFTPVDGLPRPNVLITRDVGAKETLLLLTHFDVVPAGDDWDQDPFTVREEDGKLHGRGVADDKAGVACCLTAMHALQNPAYNLKLLVTCDEEVGGEWGIQAMMKEHADALQSDVCLVVDGGLDSFETGCSGIIWGTITISGKGGHAGYDFKTGNVVHAALGFLHELTQYAQVRKQVISKLDAPENPISPKLFGRFNMTMLSAGTQPNVLPPEVKVRFDLRMIPEEEGQDVVRHFDGYVKQLAQKHQISVTVSFDMVENGFSSLDSPYTKRLHEAASTTMGKTLPLAAEFGGIDGMHVAHAGIPTFNFGPGECDIHSNKENMPKENLEKTLSFLQRALSP